MEPKNKGMEGDFLLQWPVFFSSGSVRVPVPLADCDGTWRFFSGTLDQPPKKMNRWVSDWDPGHPTPMHLTWTKRTPHLKLQILQAKKKLLYFEWSPPWHVGWRLSGEGCLWEYDGKNGEFENIDFRFPWLSDTSEMGFGHDVPFLNYSDRLPHPSDLCQPDRVRWG